MNSKTDFAVVVKRLRRVALAILMMAGTPAIAADALVAVATNFAHPARALEAEFEKISDFDVTLSFGSTGSLYAQVVHGAPYDALLSADEERPVMLERSGHAVSGSRFDYAHGKLALWSAYANRISADGISTISEGDFRKFAIANPKLAPYGSAAMEVLINLGLLDSIESKIVYAENVGQAHSIVATKNAELGLIAATSVSGGSRWIVSENLYSPIRQQAVLLSHGGTNDAAIAFLEYLRSDDGRSLVRSFGYGLN